MTYDLRIFFFSLESQEGIAPIGKIGFLVCCINYYLTFSSKVDPILGNDSLLLNLVHTCTDAS